MTDEHVEKGTPSSQQRPMFVFDNFGIIGLAFMIIMTWLSYTATVELKPILSKIFQSNTKR